MPVATSNGIEVYYETFGEPADPPVLLVMGFTAQMIQWDEAFCRLLAKEGFFVVRYDNRDVGLSTKTAGDPPEFGAPPPYTMRDMAADGIGLLDALAIGSAHVVGASMGGFIVQHMAWEHPARVRSMTSIMSTTGSPDVGQATPEAMAALMTPPPAERDEYIEHSVRVSRTISGPLWDEGRARRLAAARFDRCFHPVGAAFQMAAVLADGDRTEAVGRIDCPVLVIHGSADPLVGLTGGEATAKAIPGAELLVLDDMGHDLPAPLWPAIVGAIARHCRR